MKNKTTIQIDEDLKTILRNWKYDRKLSSINDLLWQIVKEEKNDK